MLSGLIECAKMIFKDFQEHLEVTFSNWKKKWILSKLQADFEQISDEFWESLMRIFS